MTVDRPSQCSSGVPHPCQTLHLCLQPDVQGAAGLLGLKAQTPGVHRPKPSPVNLLDTGAHPAYISSMGLVTCNPPACGELFFWLQSVDSSSTKNCSKLCQKNVSPGVLEVLHRVLGCVCVCVCFVFCVRGCFTQIANWPPTYHTTSVVHCSAQMSPNPPTVETEVTQNTQHRCLPTPSLCDYMPLVTVRNIFSFRA